MEVAKMKNYSSPEIEVISAEATGVLTVSIGDIDVNIEEGFF